MPKHHPRWLILVYANGHNDLEPEIYRSIKSILTAHWPTDIKIIIQIARAPRKLVRALRTTAPPPPANPTENWVGVRRYIIKSQGSVLPPLDYGTLNMADPGTLYDFLLWGMQYHPTATHVMAIISGHGGGFIGAMPDFTGNYPQIMTLGGLSAAFDLWKLQTRRQIDVLMLDSCHMNMLEVWFEFALSPHSPVDYLLVPGGANPLEGWPYREILQTLSDADHLADTPTEKLINFTKTINRSAIHSGGAMLVDLNRAYFLQLKHAFDQLGALLINHHRQPAQLLNSLFAADAGYPLVQLSRFCTGLAASVPATIHIINTILGLWPQIAPETPVGPTTDRYDTGGYLYLNTNPKQPAFFRRYYSKLLFAANNRWSTLSHHPSRKKPGSKSTHLINGKRQLPPSAPIPPDNLLALIMEYNPQLTANQARHRQKKMGWLRPTRF